MEDVIIRPFEPKDAEAFIMLGKWLQENSDFADRGFDQAKVFRLFVTVVENPDYFGIMVEKDGEVIGALFGLVQEYYFSRKKFALDLGFGLLPDHRHLAKTVLPRIIRAFESWAKRAGAVEVAISTSTMAHGEKLEAGLHQLGYTTVGFTVKKRFL
jgi:hypothetical protein